MAITARQLPQSPLRPTLVPVPAEQPGDPEREALGALDAGNLDAVLQILMGAYGTSIFRYCNSLMTNPDLAEEAHQLTFVQAFESLRSFGRRSSFRSWLFAIARHRCLDAAKTHRRRDRRFPAVDSLPEWVQEVNPPEDRFSRRDRSHALQDCLSRLPGRIRDVILLRYQQDLSYVEMEEIRQERAATLQARVARALPKLRRCLEGRGIQW